MRRMADMDFMDAISQLAFPVDTRRARNFSGRIRYRIKRVTWPMKNQTEIPEEALIQS